MDAMNNDDIIPQTEEVNLRSSALIFEEIENGVARNRQPNWSCSAENHSIRLPRIGAFVNGNTNSNIIHSGEISPPLACARRAVIGGWWT